MCLKYHTMQVGRSVCIVSGCLLCLLCLSLAGWLSALFVAGWLAVCFVCLWMSAFLCVSVCLSVCHCLSVCSAAWLPACVWVETFKGTQQFHKMVSCLSVPVTPAGRPPWQRSAVYLSTHTRRHTHTHTVRQSFIHWCMRAHTLVRAHTPHTHHTHTHTHTHTHWHTHTHTTHTHTGTNTHTHTLMVTTDRGV